MRLVLILFVLAMAISSCSTAKYGCPATQYSGETYKAKKFKW